jgi:hypothetical protein
MERRKAIATAAAASLTLVAGATAITLNSGIVGVRGDDNVGQLSPVTTAAIPSLTVYADEPSTGAVEPSPAVAPSTRPPVTVSTASGSNASNGHEDAREHEPEDGEREYEGADDDD